MIECQLARQLGVSKCGTFEVHGSNRQGDEGKKHCRVGRHLQATERERESEREREIERKWKRKRKRERK
jgi:hypothetical protein